MPQSLFYAPFNAVEQVLNTFECPPSPNEWTEQDQQSQHPNGWLPALELGQDNQIPDSPPPFFDPISELNSSPENPPGVAIATSDTGNAGALTENAINDTLPLTYFDTNDQHNIPDFPPSSGARQSPSAEPQPKKRRRVSIPQNVLPQLPSPSPAVEATTSQKELGLQIVTNADANVADNEMIGIVAEHVVDIVREVLPGNSFCGTTQGDSSAPNMGGGTFPNAMVGSAVYSKAQFPSGFEADNSLHQAHDNDRARHLFTTAIVESSPNNTASEALIAAIPDGTCSQDLEQHLSTNLASSAAMQAIDEPEARKQNIQVLRDIHADPQRQILQVELEDLISFPDLDVVPSTSPDLTTPINIRHTSSAAAINHSAVPQQRTLSEAKVLREAPQDQIHQAPVQTTMVGEFKYGTVRIQNPAKCGECGKLYIDEEDLAKHMMKTHPSTAGKGDWICVECGMHLKTDSSHLRHIMIVHRGTLKYRCEVCDTGFTTSQALATHERDQHDTHPSSVSTKTAAITRKRRRAQLQKKLLLHKCLTCSHQTTVKGNMERHIKIKHVQVRPFKCEICKETFGTKHNFQIHRIGH